MALNDRNIAQFIRGVERSLDRTLDRLSADLESSESAVRAAANLERFEELLLQNGLSQELDRLSEIFGNEMRDVREKLSQIQGVDLTFTEPDFALVEQMIIFETDKASIMLESLGADVKSLMFRQFILEENVRDTVLQIQDNLSPRTLANLETELFTSTDGVNRAMTLKKGNDLGIERYKYAGPLDNKNRDFCREHVGQIFTKDEIADLDNGQGLSVASFMGGFNCRHRWEAVR